MLDQRQCDYRWGSLKYDGVNNFCKFGCFVVSLANLLDKSPIDVASILRGNNLFTDGYINDIAKAAQVLGLEYHGKSTSKPDYDCIAWTNYFDNKSTSAIEKHFFIVKKDGSLVDPLGKGIYYPIKEYYLFKRKDDNMEFYKASNENNVYKYDPDFDLYYGITDPNKVPWNEVKPARPPGTEFVPKGSEIKTITEYIKEVKVEYKDNPETLAALEDLKAKIKKIEEEKEKEEIAISWIRSLINKLLGRS